MDRIPTLLLTAPYFPPQGGGLERYALQMARLLSSDYNWRVVVLTSGEKGGADRIEKHEGLTVYRLGYDLRLSNTPLGWRWAGKIRRILERERPDLINVHTPVPGLGDLVSLLARQLPQTVTYHTGSMRKGKFLPDALIGLYECICLPYLLRRARSIICSSDFVRFDFLKNYAGKSVTVTPGVDCADFTPCRGNQNSLPTVLFVAGMDRGQEYKGLQTLLDAIKILSTDLAEVRLQAVGDGAKRTDYEDYARQIGVDQQVEFCGRLAGEKLLQKYQAARVFALPTSKDSHPLVLLEAMASGLPVVSTTIGGIPAMITDGEEGYLIPPQNAPLLAAKIKRLLTDKKLATNFAAAARERARREFSWESRAFAYDQALRRALESRTPRRTHL